VVYSQNPKAGSIVTKVGEYIISLVDDR
jgi:hypothetical protein